MTPLRVIVLVLTLGGLIRPVGAIDLAGNVQQLQGSAQAVSTTGLARPLRIGSTILVGDQLRTMTDTRLHLRMNDGAALALGDHTTMTVAAYEAEEPLGRAVLDLEKGALLVTAGAIARRGSGHFTVNTPVAVLDIQNSEVWANLSPDRLAVLLLSGDGVTVTTAEGSIGLAEAETGVEIALGQTLPRPAK